MDALTRKDILKAFSAALDIMERSNDDLVRVETSEKDKMTSAVVLVKGFPGTQEVITPVDLVIARWDKRKKAVKK